MNATSPTTDSATRRARSSRAAPGELANGRRPPSGYIRLLRDLPGHRWFKPLLVVLLTVVYYLVLLVGIVIVFGLWSVVSAGGVLGGIDATISGIDDMNTVTGMVLALVSVIVMWPALELAMLSVYQRWFFPLISVRPGLGLRFGPGLGSGAVPGGMRWRLLGRYLLLALPVWVVGLIVLGIVAPESVALDRGADWDGRLALMLVLVLLLVPVQAMSEELVFRGLAMNVIGSWLRSPWWAVLIPVPFFVFGHLYDVPGLISVGVFAVVMGLLTLWTSGLEAAIAFHTVNNLFAFGLCVLTGADLNATDAPAAQIAVGMAAPIVFALVVIVDARLHGPELRVPRGPGVASDPGAGQSPDPVGRGAGLRAPRRPVSSRSEAHSGEVLPPRGDVVGDLPQDHLGGGV
ncbi:CPBP family intramembrane glutamic endopeptidase [Brevibacterium ammoniilyticum]